MKNLKNGSRPRLTEKKVARTGTASGSNFHKARALSHARAAARGWCWAGVAGEWPGGFGAHFWVLGGTPRAIAMNESRDRSGTTADRRLVSITCPVAGRLTTANRHLYAEQRSPRTASRLLARAPHVRRTDDERGS